MYIMCLSKGLAAMQQAMDEGLLPTKTLAFIPTAGETYPDPYFVEDSRQRLQQLGIRLVELDVTNALREELIQKMDDADGLFIAGGNSFYLLQQLRKKQLDTYIVQKVRDGMPYFGESAGAVLLVADLKPVEPLDDPKDAPELASTASLGLVDFFPLPHVGKEKYRVVFEKFIADNKDTLTIVAYRDDQAILTRDGHAYEILPSEITPVTPLSA